MPHTRSSNLFDSSPGSDRAHRFEPLEAVPVPLCCLGSEGEVCWFNGVFRCEFPTVEADKIAAGTPFEDLFEASDRPPVRRFLDSSEPGDSITACLLASRFGERTVLLIQGQPLSQGEDGAGVRCVSVQSFREIDEYTRARTTEIALPPGADSSFRSVVTRIADAVPIPVWAINHDSQVSVWNLAAERLLGVGRNEIAERGENYLASIGVRTQPRPDRANVLPDPSAEAAVKVPARDGSDRWVRWFTIGDAWSVRGWRSWGIGLDVTEQYNAFRALQETERRYRDVLRNVDLAGIMVDEQGRVLYLNDHLLRLGGWSEFSLLGLPWQKAFTEGAGTRIDYDALSKVLSLEPFEGRAEGRLTMPSGEVRDLVWTQSLFRDVDGRVVGACALGTDLTEHRQAQAQLSAHRDRLEDLVNERSTALRESERRLRDAERLAALGELSAGVSHDLSNMLLPVRCHLDRLAKEATSDSQRESLRAVRSGIEFLDNLGEGLEILSNGAEQAATQPHARFGSFPIGEWWDEVRSLIVGLVSDDVTIAERIEPAGAIVRVPKHLLTRAVMNLVTNAVEAARSGGEKTGTPPELTIRIGRGPGGQVEIAVGDNGAGIDETVRHRAADPFYTTKPRSLSTGLGLSIARGVAHMAGGSLELARGTAGGAPNGTSAVLRLPSSDAIQPTPSFPSPPSNEAMPSVLIAMDDPRHAAICRAVCEALPCRIVDKDEADGIGADQLTILTNHKSPEDSDDPRSGCILKIDPNRGVKAIRNALLTSFERK